MIRRGNNPRVTDIRIDSNFFLKKRQKYQSTQVLSINVYVLRTMELKYF